jgi:hypothetical protein
MGHEQTLALIAARRFHSITASAAAQTEDGTLMPNASTVLILMASSNLLGNRIGNSAGFAPLNAIHISRSLVERFSGIVAVGDQAASTVWRPFSQPYFSDLVSNVGAVRK